MKIWSSLILIVCCFNFYNYFFFSIFILIVITVLFLYLIVCTIHIWFYIFVLALGFIIIVFLSNALNSYFVLFCFVYDNLAIASVDSIYNIELKIASCERVFHRD